MLVNNSDNLFNDLPALTEKDMRTKNRLRLPKAQALSLKLAKAKQSLVAAQQRAAALQERFEEVEAMELAAANNNVEACFQIRNPMR